MPAKQTVKNFASQAEIAFWDTAILLMSKGTTPRMYSQVVASMTLKLQPVTRARFTKPMPEKILTRWLQWIHLGIISIASLVLGILLGWLKTN